MFEPIIGDPVKVVRTYKGDTEHAQKLLGLHGEVVHRSDDWVFIHFQPPLETPFTTHLLGVFNRSQLQETDTLSFNNPEMLVKAKELADTYPAVLANAQVVPLL